LDTARCAGSGKAAGAYYLGPTIPVHGHLGPTYAVARCAECAHLGPPTRDGRVNAHKRATVRRDAYAGSPNASKITISFDGRRSEAADIASFVVDVFHTIQVVEGCPFVMLRHDGRSIDMVVERASKVNAGRMQFRLHVQDSEEDG
jgi:hypothetical protein